MLESNADKDAVYISLDPNRLEMKIKIGLKLTNQEKKLFTNFLWSKKDVFIWSVENMPGIDPSVIYHRLNWNQLLDQLSSVNGTTEQSAVTS